MIEGMGHQMGLQMRLVRDIEDLVFYLVRSETSQQRSFGKALIIVR